MDGGRWTVDGGRWTVDGGRCWLPSFVHRPGLLLATLGDDALDMGGVVEAHQAPAVAAKAKLGQRTVIEPHAAEEAEVEPDHVAEQGADRAAVRDGHDRLALLVGFLEVVEGHKGAGLELGVALAADPHGAAGSRLYSAMWSGKRR